ncbi:MAG TPA: UDP-N-acetylmuramoyl-L-alanine--D-glutamate ligase [Candidatus Paceibacterota bacterium]|jgi:UDP-N-acetylmuramoylalanine--D-glutamate ligase|nr:UDP-N-acetylmuramoyl-L-alanine--D-glutamate ligase [Candidatus Paceibacterota bacterium]
MKDACELFRGKKITLVGLGLLGRGVGDAEFLAKCDVHLIVTDVKSRSQLEPSVARLEKYPNVEFHLGGHQKEDFEHADLVIKAAGVPLDSQEIALARRNNIPVGMSTALFAKYAMENGATVVGVTGTRGKSTVSQMVYKVLKRTRKNVLLGGNVRGVSTLAMLPEVVAGTVCVLELDSWQLQGFGDLRMSPHIAAFTNLMPDHLNYYGGDMEKYFSDKANIFRYQGAKDSLFVGKSILEKVSAAGSTTAPQVPPPIPEEWKLKILGEHNRENASFAAAVLRALGISEQEIKNGLESFEGVEGRLQFVREMNGIKIYNDNNSTTPEATIAALNALAKGPTRSLVLIIGGSEKGLPLDELVSEIKKNCSRVVLLAHENYKGSARLAGELRKANIAFDEADRLQKAVELAMDATTEGTVLFSPAFASFGMFRNEYERNDRFLDIICAL